MLDNYFYYLLKKVNVSEEMFNRYSYLLEILFNTDFIPFKRFDNNRISDVSNLRAEFRFNEPDSGSIIKPCSILEVMVTLAYRVEHDIMYDGEVDRTYIWFEFMIKSLGLFDQTNDSINENYVCQVLETFNSGNYQPDGLGGLVHIPGYPGDLRELDTWAQMNVYLKTCEMTKK